MSKLQLQKFVDGDELDLSLQNLTDVPVKEIAKYEKLRFIDLSCNSIENIPTDIGLLIKITKLDLSKNKIKILPEEIGKMVNLEHLDLRANNLVSLPIGLCNLKKLKWLDLKGNPLSENLRSAAGDCLNESQCAKCAENVKAHLDSMRSKKEKSNEKRKLKEQEMLKKKEQEEKEVRNRKKAEKSQERLMKRQSEQEKLSQEECHLKKQEEGGDSKGRSTEGERLSKKHDSRWLGGLCVVTMVMTVLLALVLMAILLLCNHPVSSRYQHTRQWCLSINTNLHTCLRTVRDHAWRYVEKYASNYV